MANGVVRALVGDQQIHASEANQNDAKSRGEDMPLVRAPVDGRLSVEKVNGYQDQEIEDAATENIANGDVGLISQRHTPHPPAQLRTRGDSYSHGDEAGGASEDPFPEARPPERAHDDKVDLLFLGKLQNSLAGISVSRIELPHLGSDALVPEIVDRVERRHTHRGGKRPPRKGGAARFVAGR